MKKMLMLVVMMMLVVSVFAELVILPKGRILEGEIVGKKGDSIYFQSNGSIYKLTREQVKDIKNDGNLTITKLTYKKKDFLKDGVDITHLTPVPEARPITYNKLHVTDNQIYMQPKFETKVNFHTLILGVACTGLAWDYFATAGNLNDAIEFNKELKDMTNNSDLEDLYDKQISNLEKEKTRKIINGSLLSAASVVSFVVSFENVEIKASPTLFEVGYKF